MACVWPSSSLATGEEPLGFPAMQGQVPTPAGVISREPVSPSSEAAYIVVLEDSIRHPGSLAEAQIEQRDGELGLVYRHALKGYSAKFSKEDAKALRRDPRVRYVTRDRKVEATSQTVPSGIVRSAAASNENLQIDAADDLRVDADVAVLDTGIDFEHPDLNVVARADCVPENWNATTQKCIDGVGTDRFGHGTHVAGTIGALDNDEGVVGVAPGARLWAVKVLNDEGWGYVSWAIAGLDWVTARAGQIEVANMSLGAPGDNPALATALKAAVSAGIVQVAAAGNAGEDAKSASPANVAEAITVSALADYDGEAGGEAESTCDELGADDSLASFSNFGSFVDVVAPGVCILSTVPTGGSLLSPSTSAEYATMSGTSMAAPHVAGAAAILASEDNPTSAEDVAAIGLAIEEEGNLAWTDTSGDGAKEPLLDLADEAVFHTVDQVAVTGTANVQSANQALLQGKVSPGGAATQYHFEYDTTPYEVGGIAHGTSVPLAGKSAGSGASYVAVETPVTGLSSDTLYHYRLVATNAKGTFHGADRVFVTAPLSADTGGASEIASNWATLAATVDPPGLPTTYRFEYGLTASYGRSKPLMTAKSIGSGTEPVQLSKTVGGLSGSTTYHYRVIAESATGRVYGEDRTFTTKPSKWVAQSSPNPTIGEEPANAVLADVSCTSQSDCLAVGGYWGLKSPLAGADHPTAQLWDGSDWTQLEVPDPNGDAYSTLARVSCASATMCMATGEYEDGPGQYRLMAQRWDGEEWHASSVPLPAGADWGFMYDLSCPTTSFCLAVGYITDELDTQSVAWSWNGAAWSIQSSAAKLPLDWLKSVSCATSDECVATGRDSGGGAGSASWDGKEWSFQALAPVPSGHSTVFLSDIQCSSLESCIAVGNAGGTTPSAAVGHWDGGEWSVDVLSQPEGANHDILTAVSCVSQTACMAIGSIGVGGEFPHEFATPDIWRLEGETWRRQPAANRADSLVTEFEAVSCVTTTGCVTTGSFASEEELAYRILAERYAPAPSASTESATDVSEQNATLNATVNPEGLTTTYQFEYGQTKAYGGKAPAAAKGIGSGTADVSVQETLEGLEPGTAYHYRVKATNADGTTYGEDRAFTTAEPHWIQDPVVGEPAQTGFAGTIEFAVDEYEGTEFGALACEIDADLTLEPGDSGSIDQLEVESCVGTSGLLEELSAACDPYEAEAMLLPWEIEAKADAIEVLPGPPFSVSSENEECILSQTYFDPESLTLTPAEPESISTMEISGEGQAQFMDLGGVEVDMEVSGTLEMDQPGLYGIG
ncbi:MAG TPA: S8 family serine peptidase [Solirubrobacterales bacterium]|nr:S8 family serine peptidase [Solirubrobacterales bacterium]